MTAALHTLLLCGALWTAVLLYRGRRPLHFVAALAVGAGLSHLGWAGLHWAAASQHPTALIDPRVGYCVLFFPLGPLLLARDAATWRALPLALAVARSGCVFADCGGGAAGHPTDLCEFVLLVALHFVVRSSADNRAAAVFLLGFGLERLAVEPWRGAPPLGEPTLDPALIAALWSTAGAFRLLPAPLRAPVAAAIAGLATLMWGLREPARLAEPSSLDAPMTRRGVGSARRGQRSERPELTLAVSRRDFAAAAARIRPATPPGRAGLLHHGEHWDYDGLPHLVELESHPDPELREAARALARRYLVWGPTRPTWRDRLEANSRPFEPYDRAGLRAWRDRGP